MTYGEVKMEVTYSVVCPNCRYWFKRNSQEDLPGGFLSRDGLWYCRVCLPSALTGKDMSKAQWEAKSEWRTQDP